MPYAFKDKLSQSPIEGGIEITQEQYNNAVQGRVNGELWAEKGGVFQFFEEQQITVYSKLNGSEVRVSVLDDLPEDCTTIKRTDPTYVWGEDSWVPSKDTINNLRDRTIVEDYNLNGHVFETDEVSVNNMKEKMLEIMLEPLTKVMWIDKDDNVVQLSQLEFKNMLMDIGIRKNNAYLKANILKTMIANMSGDDLKNFNPQTEWDELTME